MPAQDPSQDAFMGSLATMEADGQCPIAGIISDGENRYGVGICIGDMPSATGASADFRWTARMEIEPCKDDFWEQVIECE